MLTKEARTDPNHLAAPVTMFDGGAGCDVTRTDSDEHLFVVMGLIGRTSPPAEEKTEPDLQASDESGDFVDRSDDSLLHHIERLSYFRRTGFNQILDLRHLQARGVGGFLHKGIQINRPLVDQFGDCADVLRYALDFYGDPAKRGKQLVQITGQRENLLRRFRAHALKPLREFPNDAKEPDTGQALEQECQSHDPGEDREQRCL